MNTFLIVEDINDEVFTRVIVKVKEKYLYVALTKHEKNKSDAAIYYPIRKEVSIEDKKLYDTYAKMGKVIVVITYFELYPQVYTPRQIIKNAEEEDSWKKLYFWYYITYYLYDVMYSSPRSIPQKMFKEAKKFKGSEPIDKKALVFNEKPKIIVKDEMVVFIIKDNIKENYVRYFLTIEQVSFRALKATVNIQVVDMKSSHEIAIIGKMGYLLEETFNQFLHHLGIDSRPN